MSVTEVQSVNPSNQAGSDATGTALSPNDSSLCSGSWVVAVDNEIVSGSIADSHPQLAERKSKPQLANHKRSGCTSKTKRKEHHLFPKKWIARYPRVQFTESDGSMSCQLCKQQRKCGVWVDKTCNFRLKTVTDHITSKDHLHVVAAWRKWKRNATPSASLYKHAIGSQRRNCRTLNSISSAWKT